MTFVSFQNADSIGERFIDLLSRLGIQPTSGSSIEDELLSLTHLIEITKNPMLVTGPNSVPIIRAAAGLHDFAAKVLSIETVCEFSKFVPHLKLFAENKIAFSSFGQMQPSILDDTARKLAELYIACLVAHTGTQLDLDSPSNAKGDNPDVLFTLQEGTTHSQPERWALAIKTISSNQGQTIFERIKDGVRQIDAPTCLAKKGMVVINAKDALDHDALWNGTYPNLDAAKIALCAQLVTLTNSAAAGRPQAEWDDLFAGKAVRPVLFLGQSAVRLPTAAGRQTPTSLKVLLAYGANGRLDRLGAGLAHAMNNSMQSIVSGVPGSATSPPS